MINLPDLGTLRQHCLSALAEDAGYQQEHFKYLVRILEDLSKVASHIPTIQKRTVTNLGTSRFGYEREEYHFFRQLGAALYNYNLGCSTGAGPSSMRAVPEGSIIAHVEKTNPDLPKHLIEKLRDGTFTAKDADSLTATQRKLFIPGNLYGAALKFEGEPPHPFGFGIHLHEFPLRIADLLYADAFTMTEGGCGSIQEVIRAFRQMEYFSTQETSFHRPMVFVLPDGNPMIEPLRSLFLNSELLQEETKKLIHFATDPAEGAKYIDSFLSKNPESRRVNLEKYVDPEILAEKLASNNIRSYTGIHRFPDLYSRACLAINELTAYHPTILPLATGIVVDSAEIMSKLSSADTQTTILHEGPAESDPPPQVSWLSKNAFTLCAPLPAEDMLLKFTDHVYAPQKTPALSHADLAFSKMVYGQTGFNGKPPGRVYANLPTLKLFEAMIEIGTISPLDHRFMATPPNAVSRIASTPQLQKCRRGVEKTTFIYETDLPLCPKNLERHPDVVAASRDGDLFTITVEGSHRTSTGLDVAGQLRRAGQTIS